MKEQLPLDDFEREVRKNAGAFTMIPSDGVFERISAEINPEVTKRRPFIYITFIPAIAAVLLLGAGLAFLLPAHDKSTDIPVAATSTNKEKRSPGQSRENTNDLSVAAPLQDQQSAAPVNELNAISKHPQSNSPKSGITVHSRKATSQTAILVSSSGQPAILPAKEPAVIENKKTAEPIPLEDKPNIKLVEVPELVEVLKQDSIVFSNSPVIPSDKKTVEITQDKSNKQSTSRIHTSKLVLDAFYTPEMYYNKISTEGGISKFAGPDTLVLIKVASHNSDALPTNKGIMGYSAGAKLEYRFHKYFGVSTGLVYSKRREIFHPQSASAVMFSPGSSNTPRDAGYAYYNTFKSLELPVMLNFHYAANRLSYNISTGISYSRLIGLQYFYHDPAGTEPKVESVSAVTSPYSKNNYIISINADLGYRIGNRIEIHAGPNFRQAGRSVLHFANTMSQKPYAYGITAGVRYFL